MRERRRGTAVVVCCRLRHHGTRRFLCALTAHSSSSRLRHRGTLLAVVICAITAHHSHDALFSNFSQLLSLRHPGTFGFLCPRHHGAFAFTPAPSRHILLSSPAPSRHVSLTSAPSRHISLKVRLHGTIR